MNADEQQVIVLRDGTGDYYAIPLPVAQGYRVPDELRDTIAAALTAEPEVQGYRNPSFEIKDFSFGVENPTTIGSTTGGAGKVDFQALGVIPAPPSLRLRRP